jgi:hypothetical protein
MTTFVCHDPQSCTEKPLHEGVYSPQSKSGGERWDRVRGDESIEEVECGG